MGRGERGQQELVGVRSSSRLVLLSCGAAAGVLGACANPLGSIDADYGRRASPERLRAIERFNAEQAVKPAAEVEAEENEIRERARNRFEGVERVELSLEQVRAATLANNLELRVALIDPVISAERVTEEEARFEAVFRPRAGYRETDNPTFDTTASNQQDSVFAGAGVDIPLRTGGRVSVDLFESRSETNNPFFTLNTAYNADFTVSVSQPLLRNAGRRVNTYAIRVAAYQDQITQARTKLEVIRRLADADRSYWALDAARRALDVAQQQYELADEQLARARRRVDAGDVAEIELVRAEAGLAGRLEAIIIAENAVLQQQRALKRIINQEGLEVETTTMVVPATLPDPVRYEFEGRELAQRALATRMEMLELELQLAQDLSSIEFAKNQALPSFLLDYQYSVGGLGASWRSANDQLLDNNFESWSVSLSGEIPLGNVAAKSRVNQAILARLQRLATREAREQAIREEVLGSIDNVDASWQRIMAARQNAIASARALQAEQRQFDVGERTTTEVLEAAAQLADAQRSEIRAIADYQISLVDLAFATGTLLGASKLEWGPVDPRDGVNDDPTPPAFPYTLEGVDRGLPPVETGAGEVGG